MGFIFSILGVGFVREAILRRAVAKYADSINFRRMANLLPSRIPAPYWSTPTTLLSSFTGTWQGHEAVIAEMRVGKGKSSSVYWFVGVCRRDNERFNPPSSLTIQGYSFQERDRWMLVTLPKRSFDVTILDSILGILSPDSL